MRRPGCRAWETLSRRRATGSTEATGGRNNLAHFRYHLPRGQQAVTASCSQGPWQEGHCILSCESFIAGDNLRVLGSQPLLGQRLTVFSARVPILITAASPWRLPAGLLIAYHPGRGGNVRKDGSQTEGTGAWQAGISGVQVTS